MDFESMVRMHNEALESKALDNLYLNQRIKARLKDRRMASPPLAVRVKKTALIYAFLLLIFTFINLLVIEKIERKPTGTQPLLVKMEDFQADFPGSLSKALAEVHTWQE